MKVAVRNIANCTVLELSGRLVLGAEAMELRNALREVTWNNPRNVILNLAGVSCIDSCGIGELVSSYSHVTSRGRSMVLTNVPRAVRNRMKTSRPPALFEIFDSERAAIAKATETVLLKSVSNL